MRGRDSLLSSSGHRHPTDARKGGVGQTQTQDPGKAGHGPCGMAQVFAIGADKAAGQTGGVQTGGVAPVGPGRQ
jgi:hypothetical protein